MYFLEERAEPRSLGVGLPASFLVCAAAHVAFGPEEEN